MVTLLNVSQSFGQEIGKISAAVSQWRRIINKIELSPLVHIPAPHNTPREYIKSHTFKLRESPLRILWRFIAIQWNRLTESLSWLQDLVLPIFASPHLKSVHPPVLQLPTE